MTTEHSHGTIRSSPDPGEESHPRSSIPIPAPPSPSLLPHPRSPVPIPMSAPHPHRGAFLRLLPRPSLSPRGSPSGAELWGRGSHRWSRRSQSPHRPRFGCATRTLPVSRSSQQLAVPTLCSPILPTVLHPFYSPPSLPCPCDPGPGPPGRYLPPLPPLPSCRRPALRCPHRGRGHRVLMDVSFLQSEAERGDCAANGGRGRGG